MIGMIKLNIDKANSIYKFQIQQFNSNFCKRRFQMTTQIKDDINQLIISNTKVFQYLRVNSKNDEQYKNLIIELLNESIDRRLKNSPNYNLSYVKHNRFLSPNQKKQITPKVTQIIPVSPQRVMIYGKPKIRLDNGYGCPQHYENCQEDQQAQQIQNPKVNPKRNKQNNNFYKSSQQIHDLPINYEQYLSPKHSNAVKKQKKSNKNTSQNDFSQTQIKSPTRNVDSKLQIRSPRCKNTKRTAQNEDYNHVESKIKSLVQMDKHNKQIQKKLQEQRSEIQDIEERQNRLLMMQKYQNQILSSPVRQYQNDSNYQVTTQIHRTNGKYSSRQVVNLSESFSSENFDESVVNLHGHQDQTSRIKCYDCEIQRLRKRKEKAQLAIQQLNKEEKRRTKMFKQIMQPEAYYPHQSRVPYNIY